MLIPDKLNLGCGFDHRAGYLNVDFVEAHSPDLLSDVRILSELEKGSFEEILARDVLEHLPRTDTAATLDRWSELLVTGGRLVIRTTDVIGLAGMLSHHRGPSDQLVLLQNLFGTQAYDGDYHLTGFTESSLRWQLHQAGLEVVSMERFDHWLLDCVAVKPEVLAPFEPGPLPLMDVPKIGQPDAPSTSVADPGSRGLLNRLPSRLEQALRGSPALAPLRSFVNRFRASS